MAEMKVLLIGRRGNLGRAFLRDWAKRHEVSAWGREEMDLSEVSEIKKTLQAENFEVLVNCAGMTKPDECEQEAELARLVNVEAPGEMASYCADEGKRFVHFSTDYVTNAPDQLGIGEGQYEEGISVYGKTKLEGERRVMENFADAIVARVSWLFGGGREGFLEKIVRLALTDEKIEGIGDKFSKPTFCSDVTRWVEEILGLKNHGGIWHLTHPGGAESWVSYAQKVLELMQACEMIAEKPAVGCNALDDCTFFTAPRPRYTVLEPQRMKGAGIVLRSWEEAARECLHVYH